MAKLVSSHVAQGYPLAGASWGSEKAEAIPAHFTGMVQGAYKANGVVFATILARLLLFTEGAFKFERLDSGQLFGSTALTLLERPWPNATTGDLLARMEQDASLAGNFYAAVRGGTSARVRRMRPDWVKIVVGSPSGDPDDLDSEPLGYLYEPPTGRVKPVMLLPEEVCHFAPVPDPEAQFRGMSWLTPVVTEIQADGLATKHKRKFFENAATPNLSVSLAKEISPERFKQFIEMMDEQHTGWENAYKTLYTAGGADVKVVGADFRQIDFKATQGAGETRIAAAGGVPPIVVGLSEGLDASTYSNYGQARRKFGDHWARPQWRNAAASLAPLVDVPAGARLAHDPTGIAFLQEDQKDEAEIQHRTAETITAYVREGFTPESAIAAVTTGNLSNLKHTGLVSVQLHTPGAEPTKGDDA